MSSLGGATAATRFASELLGPETDRHCSRKFEADAGEIEKLTVITDPVEPIPYYDRRLAEIGGVKFVMAFRERSMAGR